VREAPSQYYSSDRYRDQDLDDAQAGPLVTRRFDNDGRRYDPRYGDGAAYGGRSDYRRRYFNDRQFDDRDDYGAWDAAPVPRPPQPTSPTLIALVTVWLDTMAGKPATSAPAVPRMKLRRSETNLSIFIFFFSLLRYKY